MSQTLQALAPAKINLFLRVTGKRANGYHELDSLFLPVALYDRVAVTLSASSRPSIKLKSTLPGLPTDERNLAYRAAKEMLERCGRTFEVTINLEKAIPVGGGLGGGSSDCASVLKLLANEFGGLSEQELRELALTLGADVPFFLVGQPARVSGIGEIINLLPRAPLLDLVLVTAPVEVSTARVFAHLKASDWSGPAPDEEIEQFCAGKVSPELVRNDLLRPALSLYPEIAEAWRILETTCPQVCGLSGSGATVFGVYPDAESARRASEKIRNAKPELSVCAVRTLGVNAHSS